MVKVSFKGSGFPKEISALSSKMLEDVPSEDKFG